MNIERPEKELFVTALSLSEVERFRRLAEELSPGLGSQDSPTPPEDRGRSAYQVIVDRTRNTICSDETVRRLSVELEGRHDVDLGLAICDLLATFIGGPAIFLISAQIVYSGVHMFCDRYWKK